MTTPPPYNHEPFQPQPPPGQPRPENPAPFEIPAQKRRSRFPLILGAAIGVIFIIALTVVITLAATSKPTTKAPAADAQQQAATTTPIDAGEEGVPTEEPTTGPTPEAKDLALRAKITSKDCFGSAGCLVDFKVQLDYDGPVLSPDDTWEITYEVHGVEDGPLIGSFDLTGDTYEVNEESVQTKSSKSTITIKVTDVDKVGI